MILVVNAGSSSIKVEVFGPNLTSHLTADVAGIGGTARLRVGEARSATEAPDHAAALAVLLDALKARGVTLDRLSAAAHRVVHGGAAFVAPARLTPEVIAGIEACVPLAPLHNPANLAGIRALSALAPDLAQFASFDTAFHATNPEVETAYALPAALRAQGLRRYGFHGLSYASIAARLDPVPQRLLAYHLGNGASACAMVNGRSVATSMGYSPVSGLVMGTRSGDIDAMLVTALTRAHGIERAEDILNRDSGLKGLGGTNDMAALLARDDAEARFAVAHFCHWAIRHGGGLIAAMGGIDAMVFTGGIGENAAPIRDTISGGLRWAGDVPVTVIEADEERQIARDALALMER